MEDAALDKGLKLRSTRDALNSIKSAIEASNNPIYGAGMAIANMEKDSLLDPADIDDLKKALVVLLDKKIAATNKELKAL